MAETPQGHRDAGQVRADAERELEEQLGTTRENVVDEARGQASGQAQAVGDRQKGAGQGRTTPELETEQERRQREERERVAGQPV